MGYILLSLILYLERTIASCPNSTYLFVLIILFLLIKRVWMVFIHHFLSFSFLSRLRSLIDDVNEQRHSYSLTRPINTNYHCQKLQTAIMNGPAAENPVAVAQRKLAYSTNDVLAHHSPFSPEDRLRYVTRLSDDGATNLLYLEDANDTRGDLVALGIKQPHVASVLRAITAAATTDPPIIVAAATLAPQDVQNPLPPVLGDEGLELLQGPAIPPAPANIEEEVVMLPFEPLEGMDQDEADKYRAINATIQHRGNPGNVRVGLEAMEEHKLDPRKLGDLGICEIVLQTTDIWPTNKDIMLSALRAVSYLAENHPGNRA